MPTRQSITDKKYVPGQGCGLQASETFDGPEQSDPPFAASSFTDLILILVPSPQLLEHWPTSHLSSHSQLTEVALAEKLHSTVTFLFYVS